MMSAMKVEHSVRYDAPLADVYSMLTDTAFRERATRAQRAEQLSVSVDGGHVSIDMHQPTTDLPGFARKIVGATSHVIQAETWNGTDSADFSVTMPGTPGSISGVRTLKADGHGTLDTFDGEAKATVPLIGAKLESLISTKLKEGWDTEHGVGVAWLAGDR
jgi:uncharacterized protein YndB with AHSA1/START domain